MTEQEARAAVEAAQKAEAKAKELETQLSQTREQLGKLQNKDLNFRRLEQMTEAEKEKLTATEKQLMQQAEQLEAKTKELEGNTLAFHRRNAISLAARGNEDVAKELETAWNDISGEPKTEQEFLEKAAKVYRLVKGTTPQFSAVTSAFAQVGSAPPSDQGTKKGYGDTEEGKNLANRLGMVLEPPKK